MSELTAKQAGRLRGVTWDDLMPVMPHIDSLVTMTNHQFQCRFPGESILPQPTSKQLAEKYPDFPAAQREAAMQGDLRVAGLLSRDWPAERYGGMSGRAKNRRQFAAWLLEINYRLGPYTRRALADMLLAKPKVGRPAKQNMPVSRRELELAVALAGEYLLQAGSLGMTQMEYERRMLRVRNEPIKAVRRESFRAAVERIRFVIARAEK